MTDDPTIPIETPVEPTMSAEPMVQTVPTGPVEPAVATSPAGGSRTRWAVALAIVALAIVGTVGAALLFGQQSAPSALQYVPGNAAVVAEIRLDLPGDQMQHMGNLLAHFPGFADQSTLAAKLDEALGKFVQSASDGKADYVTDLKPWVNGPLFVAALDLADSSTSDGPQRMVISATTNGAVDCATVFKDQAMTHETYKGLDLVLAADGATGCVVDGHQALFGDPATVRLALDAKAAGTGMDKSANYQAARSALGGDRLATVYVDGLSIAGLIPKPSGLGVPGVDGLIGQIPPWLMAGARAEDDGFVLDFVTAAAPTAATGPSIAAMPATHASVIAPLIPGDTLAYLEVQGAGVSLQNLLAQLGSNPDLATALQMLDGIGGAGEAVGWIDDVGIVISVHDQAPDGALLLVAADEAAATSRVASLKTVLALLGSGGSGIEVANTTVNGVAVTTVTITDVGALVPPGTVPGLGDIPTAGPISFSFAAHGKVLFVTLGENAMSAILNTAAGSSLADNPAFKHAATRGLTNARTTIYLGVGATVELAKSFMTAEQLATYQSDAAPYLDPFEAFLLQATNDATGIQSRMVITVSKP